MSVRFYATPISSPEETCSICLLEYSDERIKYGHDNGEDVAIRLHFLCIKCLQSLQKPECPQCRARIYTERIIDDEDDEDCCDPCNRLFPPPSIEGMCQLKVIWWGFSASYFCCAGPMSAAAGALFTLSIAKPLARAGARLIHYLAENPRSNDVAEVV